MKANWHCDALLHRPLQVWVNAAAQVFNSLGIGFGSMVSMASYSRYNNNVLRYGLNPPNERRIVSSQQSSGHSSTGWNQRLPSSIQGRLTGGGHQLVYQHPGRHCHLLGHRLHGSHAQPPSGQHSHGRWAMHADGLLALILPPLADLSVYIVSGTWYVVQVLAWCLWCTRTSSPPCPSPSCGPVSSSSCCCVWAWTAR